MAKKSCAAREIKNGDEIQIHDAALPPGVDAAFYQMARALHPGVKENELQAVAAAGRLHRQGSAVDT